MGSTNFTPPPLKWLTPPPEKNLVHMYDRSRISLFQGPQFGDPNSGSNFGVLKFRVPNFEAPNWAFFIA
jgi:hypothetical protein